ncbi:MAG: hypothetical protein EHM45_22250, partial [Desulfobacteraceae bacterium]
MTSKPYRPYNKLNKHKLIGPFPDKRERGGHLLTSGAEKGVFDPMMRIKYLFLTIILFLILMADSARADCWAVYTESYRSFYYQCSGIMLPQRAGSFASLADCEATLSEMRSNPDYRYDTGLHKTYCECANTGGGSVSTGGSFEQQLTGTLVSSFLNLLLNGLRTDPGAAGEAQRQALQKKWDKEETDRRLTEKKRQEAAFANAQAGALGLLGNRPGTTSGVSTQTGAGPKPGGTSFFGLGGGTG